MNAETIAMNSVLAEAERVKKAPPVPEVAPKLHPLARFLDFDGTAKPPRWVIPGFIGHGVVVVAGAHGVGKTTAILPLALVAAGLHGDQLMPRQWRHVVYITEDVEQARRILSGVVRHSNLGISLEDACIGYWRCKSLPHCVGLSERCKRFRAQYRPVAEGQFLAPAPKFRQPR
jgi:hypothetical protein